MTLKLRKIYQNKHCHNCGESLQGKYGSEVGLVITIYLCQPCALANKHKIFELPDEIELKPRALTFEPLALAIKGG